MSTTKHTVEAQCPFGNGELAVSIGYRVTWGAPETGPTYSCGGQPADPDEIELVDVSPESDDCSLSDEAKLLLDDWASEWLASDVGADRALTNAREGGE